MQHQRRMLGNGVCKEKKTICRKIIDNNEAGRNVSSRECK